MNALSILKYICMLILVAGLNQMFKENGARRNFKNTGQFKNYDSLVIERMDSLLTTYRK